MLDKRHKILYTREPYEIRFEPHYSRDREYTIWGPDINGRHCRMAACSDLGRAHRCLTEILGRRS